MTTAETRSVTAAGCESRQAPAAAPAVAPGVAPAPAGPGVRGIRAVLGAGLLGGIATTSGIALTATSGWLIVRASERPVILMLLTAIVAVRTFGMARPVFRYWERCAPMTWP